MTAECRPGLKPSPGLDAQIGADFPGDELLAALLSPSPPARPRPRRPPGPRTRASRAAASSAPRPSPAAGTGTYRLILAYAATLAPGADGIAPIDPGAALAWILASGTWAHAGRPAARQRKIVMTTLANLAGRGRIRRDERGAGYPTHPPGHQEGT